MSPGALRQAALKIEASKLTQREAEFVQSARRLNAYFEKQEAWLLALARRQGVKVSETDTAPAVEPDRAQRRAAAPKISFRDREPDPFRAQTAAALRDMRAAGLHRRLSQGPSTLAKPSVADRMRLRDALSPPRPMVVCYGQLGTPSARPYGAPAPAPSSSGFGMDPWEGIPKMLAPTREKWSEHMDRELDDFRHGRSSDMLDGSHSPDPDFQELDMSIWGLPD